MVTACTRVPQSGHVKTMALGRCPGDSFSRSACFTAKTAISGPGKFAICSATGGASMLVMSPLSIASISSTWTTSGDGGSVACSISVASAGIIPTFAPPWMIRMPSWTLPSATCVPLSGASEDAVYCEMSNLANLSHFGVPGWIPVSGGAATGFGVALIIGCRGTIFGCGGDWTNCCTKADLGKISETGTCWFLGDGEFLGWEGFLCDDEELAGEIGGTAGFFMRIL